MTINVNPQHGVDGGPYPLIPHTIQYILKQLTVPGSLWLSSLSALGLVHCTNYDTSMYVPTYYTDIGSYIFAIGITLYWIVGNNDR